MVWEELRSGGHNWKGVRQSDDEFTEKSWEAVRVRCMSYRQTLSLDPIALHFLNLETSATRHVRVLLVLSGKYMPVSVIWATTQFLPILDSSCGGSPKYPTFVIFLQSEAFCASKSCFLCIFCAVIFFNLFGACWMFSSPFPGSVRPKTCCQATSRSSL